MIEWVFVLLGPFFPPAHKDHIGALAVEAAYVSVQPATPVKKKKVNTADCKTCNGTGRVRTGDGQGWTKCPDCEPAANAVLPLPNVQNPLIPADLLPPTAPVQPEVKYWPLKEPAAKEPAASVPQTTTKPATPSVPERSVPTTRVYVR